MKTKGFISIISSAALALSMLSVTAVSAENETFSGDINGDGTVTAVDASCILTDYALTSSGNKSIFTNEQKKAADVNGDNIVDGRDASSVLGYYALCSVYGTRITLEKFIELSVRPCDYPLLSMDRPAYVEYSLIPPYEGKPYTVLNNNIPTFDTSDYSAGIHGSINYLDYMGRCSVCSAVLNKGTTVDSPPETMTADIEEPTGWHTDKYEFINGGYLYNRCYLLEFFGSSGFELPNNVITGTQYLYNEGMVPFRDQVISKLNSTDITVIYRVTPVFVNDELVCRGVVMEGWSVEDSGASVCFNVFCYNVQPGVIIDYATGESHADESYIENVKSNVHE